MTTRGFLIALSALTLLACIVSIHGGPFDDWDRNRDGKLSREELPESLRRMFDAIDTNRDGFISGEEDRAVPTRDQRAGWALEEAIPESVKATLDIPYAGTENPAQCLDLFLPAKRANDKPLPVIVLIHGGAWQMGSKSGARAALSFVATGQYAGASIDYRLSDEAKWPAHAHDCKAAIRWIKAHAKEHHLDPEKIAVWGSSAGGHLVAMLGVSGGVPELDGTLGQNLEQSSRVTCVADYFGPTNLLTLDDFPSKVAHNDANSPASLLIGGALQENKDKARSASPLAYVTKDDAPVFIAHGTADPIVPCNQSEIFEAALKKAGVPAYLQTIAEGSHGGFDGPKLDGRLKKFFDKYLRGVVAEIETGRLKERE